FNKISKSSGKWEYALETSDTGSSIDIVTLDCSPDTYEGGIVQFDIKVLVMKYPPLMMQYSFRAYAGNDITNIITRVEDGNITGFGGDPETYKPELTWSASGDDRTLSINCNQQFSGYKIDIDFN